ncbi:MAG: ASCH domain-containing protein [Nanoarchaeota archaeon]|nr:ASCH domain-containing protein [Nanoarchaeota archaeon]MBU4124508.1 ASCH domain-containing protein [Nanoarchaeota archaeon]
MKALTIKQPYAHLIMNGIKTIELRSWNTKFRGEFLIHSSQKLDMNELKLKKLVDLETGKILGKVTLIDIKKYNNLKELMKDKNKCQVRSNKKWKFPMYGFVLTNPKKIKPIKYKGNLGFWNCTQKI